MHRTKILAAVICVFLLAIGIIFYVFPPGEVATDPDKMDRGVSAMSYIPVALMWIGSAFLGAVLAYGIVHTKRRSRREMRDTQAGTKELYRREDADSRGA
jgi:uncharacterized membrane protein